LIELEPRCEAARIRAFFVHPEWARRGIGAMILEVCESAAVAAGFTRLEMGATLTGVPLYLAKGYRRGGSRGRTTGWGNAAHRTYGEDGGVRSTITFVRRPLRVNIDW
jgi:GNAT superfamily N-acetyltransferase